MHKEDLRSEWEAKQNEGKKINYYSFCDLAKCKQPNAVRQKIADGIRYIHWLEQKIVDISKDKNNV